MIFDLDGTLVDSIQDLADATNDALAASGLPTRPTEAVRLMVGNGAKKLIERALPAGAEDRFADVFSAFQEAYALRLSNNTETFPGVRPMLGALRAAGLPAVIATNKPARFTEAIVRRLRLDQLGILAWASGDEVPAPKPDPRTLQLALDRAQLRFHAAELAYVGDMPVDVKSARNFGALSLIVGWGLDPAAARAAKPDRFIETTPALEEALLAYAKHTH